MDDFQAYGKQYATICTQLEMVERMRGLLETQLDGLAKQKEQLITKRECIKKNLLTAAIAANVPTNQVEGEKTC